MKRTRGGVVTGEMKWQDEVDNPPSLIQQIL